jgi:hypothetical protein
MEVARSKQNSLLAKTQKSAIKEVVGSCQSLRISIQGLTPKEMIEAIGSGKLDDYIEGKTDKLPTLVHREEAVVRIVGLEEKKEEAPAVKEEKKKEEAPAEEKREPSTDKKVREKKADDRKG